MTTDEFKLLKSGDRVRVKDFNNFYNGRIVTIQSVGSISYNPRANKQDYEVVTQFFEHNCECGCKGTTRLALHSHNVENVN